jgi:Protein of unknown function (DUF3307)
MSAAVVFAVTFCCFCSAHQLADHWLQTERQATRKGGPGWPAARACLAHVLTYHLTCAAFLALAAWLLAMPVSIPWAAGGLFVSAWTHYFADRRWPLMRVAEKLGKGDLWWLGDRYFGGSYVLDQSWHVTWLFVAALLTAGGAR